MNTDDITKNPFTESQKASRFFGDFSTSERRLVWVKGTMAKVATLSEARLAAPLPFDMAVFVLMSPRTIKIDLREETLLSSDSFLVMADMSLTCEPKDSDEALKCIAVFYRQCVLNLTRLAGSYLREACGKRSVELVAQRQTELEDGFKLVLDNESDSLNPFRISKVHLRLNCPAVEKLKQDERTEVLQAPVNRARHVNALAKLAADLEIQKKKSEQTQLETKGRIESLQTMAQLCIEAKMLVMQDNPQLAELFSNVEIARLGKDMAALESALIKVQEMVRSLAEASRGYPGNAVPNVINTKM